MDDYSNSATLQVFGIGQRFWRWLRASVTAFADDLAGAGGDSSQARVILTVTADDLRVYRRKAGAIAAEAALPGGLAASPSRLREFFRAHPVRDVLLRIGQGRAVVTRLTLPVGASDVLPAIVRNKIESLAPWPVAETVWGYRLLPRETNQLAVEVGILSRKALDAILAAIEASGGKVAFLEVAGPSERETGIPVDFRAGERGLRTARMLRGASLLIALAALGIAGYGSYLALGAQADLSAAAARIDVLQHALRGDRKTAGTSGRLAAANALYDRKFNSRPLVVVLNALSRLVPDGTWLNSIDYEGARITINGKGSGIPAVIGALEQSDTFSDVNFAAATQHDAALNADVFSIAAAIETKGSKP